MSNISKKTPSQSCSIFPRAAKILHLVSMPPLVIPASPITFTSFSASNCWSTHSMDLILCRCIVKQRGNLLVLQMFSLVGTLQSARIVRDVVKGASSFTMPSTSLQPWQGRSSMTVIGNTWISQHSTRGWKVISKLSLRGLEGRALLTPLETTRLWGNILTIWRPIKFPSWHCTRHLLAIPRGIREVRSVFTIGKVMARFSESFSGSKVECVASFLFDLSKE